MVMGAVLFIITYLRYTLSGQMERGGEREMLMQLVCKGMRGERKRSRRDTVKIPFKLTLYFY
jgi:hypothetical protein